MPGNYKNKKQKTPTSLHIIDASRKLGNEWGKINSAWLPYDKQLL